MIMQKNESASLLGIESYQDRDEWSTLVKHSLLFKKHVLKLTFN